MKFDPVRKCDADKLHAAGEYADMLLLSSHLPSVATLATDAIFRLPPMLSMLASRRRSIASVEDATAASSTGARFQVARCRTEQQPLGWKRCARPDSI